MKDESVLKSDNKEVEACFITGDERGINVPFDRIFKRDDVKLFNSLPLIKRIQINQTDLIVEDWQIVMSNDVELYYKLLALIYDIRIENKGANIENVIMSFIDENPIIMKRISDNIDKNYTITLDKGASANVNIELQVTDELNKTFLKAISLMRFITPLVCLYEFENGENYDYYNIYCECLIKFNGGSSSIINKLHKIVFSRLVRTKYSNRVIWSYIRQKSDDVSITSLAITKNIVNTVLIKTKNNTSLIAFLDVVIRNKIKFLFEYDYSVSYKSIKVNSNKELEDKEKLEIHHLKYDKGVQKLNEMAIIQECKKIYERYGKKLINERIEQLEAVCQGEVNSIQLFLLEQKYHNFKIKSLNIKRKYILMAGLGEEFLENNLDIFNRILYSRINTSSRRINIRKRTVEKISITPLYMDAMLQYSDVSTIFENNNMIRSLIDLKSNVFEDRNGNILDINANDFIVEVLTFIKVV